MLLLFHFIIIIITLLTNKYLLLYEYRVAVVSFD
jgi:hypothetical protein